MNKNRVSGYAMPAFAFGCGYVVAGVILSAYGIWGLNWWDRGHSATPRFALVESLVFVVFFGILSLIAYLVGAIVRRVWLGSVDRPGAARAALIGSGCLAVLWLVALSGTTSLAIVLGLVTVLPGTLGCCLGGRRRAGSN
jgi:hypothetical protein